MNESPALRNQALDAEARVSPDLRPPSSLSRPKVLGPAVLICCLVLAAAIRIGLSRYSPWYDELASVFFASQPIHRLWSTWMLRETNPPLYYTILKLWADVFGPGVVSLRLPSIIASLAAIAVAYKGIGGRFGIKAGAIGAVLLALSAQQLFFSHEIRAYIFLYVAIAISFFGLLNIVQEPAPSLIGWLCYALGSVAAIYLHTTAFIWPAAASLALIAVDRRFFPVVGDRWTSLALADVAILLGGGWWLFVTIRQLLLAHSNIAWIQNPAWSDVPNILQFNLFMMRRPGRVLQAIPICMIALCIWIVFRDWRSPAIRLTVASLTLSLLLFLGFTLKQPILIDRTLLWLSIFPLVLTSVALARLRGLLFAASMAVVAGGLALNQASQARHLEVEDWTEPAGILAGTPKAVIVVDSESMDIAMNMACRVKLRLDSCPFPVVALERGGDTIDSWARGGMDSLALPRLDPTTLPADAKVYLMRRSHHDVLADLNHLNILPFNKETPHFSGPYPSSVLANLETHGTWRGHSLALDEAIPLD